MWLFLNDGFLSIVAHREKAGVLVVRARRAGDIESILPDAETWHDSTADYPNRAEVPVEAVAAALGRCIHSIHYDNFKNSVHDLARHDAYMDVWEVMRRWGEPYRIQDQEGEQSNWST